jgi:hypothetical protein
MTHVQQDRGATEQPPPETDSMRRSGGDFFSRNIDGRHVGIALLATNVYLVTYPPNHI